jgi:pimeloyl-ACP methyl ester carboxylesterase
MSSPFELKGADGKLIRGDYSHGAGRQILFINGFLSERWGNKSRALVELCRDRNWGFCCFDFRGTGDSEGNFTDYTLKNWMEDTSAVVQMIGVYGPVLIVGSSLGGWLAWLAAQEHGTVQNLLLIAPAFNMMSERAREISPERRHAWQTAGWMPYDDDEAHRRYPLSWKWVEESEELWQRRLAPPRRVKTTIMHGLQDTVIPPAVSWRFAQHVLSQAPDFPIEIVFKTGDHRLSRPNDLVHFLRVLEKGV